MVTIKRLIEGTLLAGGPATYYTAPANGTTLIKKLTFMNTDASTIVTLTIYLGASGGAAGAQYEVCKKALQPLERYECFEAENQLLQAGDFISLTVDSDNKVNVTASGAVITN